MTTPARPGPQRTGPRDPSTVLVLGGLLAGLAIGIVADATRQAALLKFAALVAPVGTLFINAIRMTVIPLVMACIIASLAGASDARTVGRLGSRALGLFIAFLALSVVFGLIVAPPLMARLPLSDEAAAALRGTALSASAVAQAAGKVPTLGQWLIDLVPVNPVQAAAEGAMLPLIVFTVVFGLAISRLEGAARATLSAAISGIAEAAMLVVRWVLVATPVGVFALSVSLGATLGLTSAAALAYYVGVVAATAVVFAVAVLYPAAVIAGRVPLRVFARAAAPAQAVALSARSSLASLPAMLAGARTTLGVPDETAGFVLPLAASTFRVGAGVGQVIAVCFIARLYGLPVSLTTLLTVGATVLIASFSVPGIPNGSMFVAIPALLAAHLPPEGIGILIGVDLIPDMFRTATNVTGDMTVVALLGRGGRAGAPGDAPAAGGADTPDAGGAAPGRTSRG